MLSGNRMQQCGVQREVAVRSDCWPHEGSLRPPCSCQILSGEPGRLGVASDLDPAVSPTHRAAVERLGDGGYSSETHCSRTTVLQAFAACVCPPEGASVWNLD